MMEVVNIEDLGNALRVKERVTNKMIDLRPKLNLAEMLGNYSKFREGLETSLEKSFWRRAVIYNRKICAFVGLIKFSMGSFVWLVTTDEAAKVKVLFFKTIKRGILSCIREMNLYSEPVYAYVLKKSSSSEKEVKFLRCLGFKSLSRLLGKGILVNRDLQCAEYFYYDYLGHDRSSNVRINKSEWVFCPDGYRQFDIVSGKFIRRYQPAYPVRRYR